MKHLFIGAHFDDIEFGCAGYVLDLVKRGDDVMFIIMTDGAASLESRPCARILEQEEACNSIGVERIKMLNLPDGFVRAEVDVIRRIASEINGFKPDCVYTHWPQDTHQDHRATAEIAMSACRRKVDLIYFDSYSSIGFVPNMYVDVSKHVDDKRKSLNCFKTQIDKFKQRGADFAEESIQRNKLCGYEVGVPYAEGYVIKRLTINGKGGQHENY